MRESARRVSMNSSATAVVVGLLVASIGAGAGSVNAEESGVRGAVSLGPVEALSLRSPGEKAAPIPRPPTVFVVGGRLSDNGDNDGWADTNETVALRIIVYNATGAEISGLTARLDTNDPRIACIIDGTATVGDIGVGETKLAEDDFVFLVGDVNRTAVDEEFTASFTITMSADQFHALPEPETVILELDLDATGGGTPTQFFEGFEGGFGAFTTMHLDADLNPPDSDINNHAAGVINADGHRCQYSDPEWENSFSYGSSSAGSCFPNPDGSPDAFFFQTTGDRAFSGAGSLYYGIPLDPSQGFTTPLGQLEALATTDPINLAWGKVCEWIGGSSEFPPISRSTSCLSDADCLVGESCVPVSPTLEFKQQISLMDHRALANQGQTFDRGVVQVQLAAADGSPAGPWHSIRAHVNAYETQTTHGYPNCFFDPIDDGNSEDDFFDPTDPDRRFGPSSTCFPERGYADQGNTDEPFAEAQLGDARDGPGLEGESGMGTWVTTRFDLSRYLGRRIRLRFLMAGIKVSWWMTWQQLGAFNPAPYDDGWWIDDVTVSDVLTSAAVLSVDMQDNTHLKDDLDLDGVGAACDCNPSDGSVWSSPGEVTDLELSHSGGASGSTTFQWQPPAEMGGTMVQFDTLGSTSAGEFESTGFCVESNDGADTMATSGVTPASGMVHYFLVRAENACGPGPLGTTSSGAPRVAMSCD